MHFSLKSVKDLPYHTEISNMMQNLKNIMLDEVWCSAKNTNWSAERFVLKEII